MYKSISEINELANDYSDSNDKDIKYQVMEEISCSMYNIIKKRVFYIVGYSNINFFKSRLGFEKEDMIQELMIVLVKSLENYNNHKNNNFYNYFRFNARNKIIQIYFTSNSSKRASLISTNNSDNEEIPIELFIGNSEQESLYEFNIRIKNIYNNDLKEIIINNSTKKEYEIVEKLFNDNLNYSQIAKKLGMSNAYITVTLNKLVTKIKNIVK